MTYDDAAHKLRDRILALIPAHPEIMVMTSAWDLFKVDGFHCKDLEPTLAMASCALASAKNAYLKGIRIL